MAQWMRKTESSDDLYKMAKHDIDLKRYQRAVNELRLGLQESPKNMDIHLLLGKAYSMAGKLDSARTELNYVREKNPRYREAYIYLVNLEATACNYQQAIEYADDGLKYFPNDKDLLLKKMDMYNKMGEWGESDKMAAYLFEHYSADPYVRSIYIEYKLSIARHYYQAGYIEIALHSYQSVLEQEPLNKEAMDAIYTLDLRSGNYAQSLIAVNRALLTNQNSYELYIKKLNILLGMYNYMEAIDVLEKLEKLYPGNAEISKNLINTRIDAGRYYMKQDPLVQFGTVLEKQPTNADALGYAINLCYTRGLMPEALGYVNNALKVSPGNRDLLAKKQGILEAMEKWDQASQIAEVLYRESPNPAGREHLLELRNATAKNYISDLQYDSAIIVLNSILALDSKNLQATNYLIGIYSEQKRYDDALRVIDDALKTYPENEQLLYRKSGILDAYQKYNEAAKVSKHLIELHPKNRYYITAFVDQTLAASRQSMQMEDYFSTVTILRQALAIQPDNIDALTYMINLELSLKQYDSALYYTNQGLKYYPDSKDFVFKKSVVYAEAHEYKAAYAISGDLYKTYPYNSRFRGLYTDQILASGKQFLNGGETDSALNEFYKALIISPNDTVPLFYTINLLNDQQKFDQALVFVERGRKVYPALPYFLLKRAVILESKKKYLEAWRAMDTLSKMGPMDQKWTDYKDFLYNKSLRDEMGLFFLNSTFDPITVVGNYSNRRIATVQYSHKFDQASLMGKVDYIGVSTGSGLMFELEGTLNHSIKTYSWANMGYSPETVLIFPSFRFSYSLFHNFNRGFDGELGIRYVSMAPSVDSNKVHSGLIGMSKEWKDFYITGHMFLTYLYYLNQQAGPYSAYTLATRYYVKDDHTDFLTVSAGYGMAPDDLSRILDVNFNAILYKTVNIGAGYQFQVHYRTTLLINYTWYNIQYHVANSPGDQNSFKNQYDLNIGLLHRF
jgi:cellulose synthase operon protein C